MIRVIGGRARGRRLVVPTQGTRPTSDRAREAVFSGIEAIRGSWHGAVVLDLYAGSGAVGLEALSRGASRVDLVDADRAAVAAMTTNVAAIAASLASAPGDVVDGVVDSAIDSAAEGAGAHGSGAHVHRADVGRWVASPPDGVRYDVVFADPPYSTTVSHPLAAMRAIVDGGVTAPGALLVLERSARDGVVDWLADSIAADLQPIWDRRFGEAHVWIAQVTAPA